MSTATTTTTMSSTTILKYIYGGLFVVGGPKGSTDRDKSQPKNYRCR
jgi:hypothetical protein